MKRTLPSLFLLFCAVFSFAQVINVPGDYTLIQDAIDAANDGDTVLVAEGTYLENLNLKGKGITLASEYLYDGLPAHISNTIIDGSSPSNPDTASVIYVPNPTDQTPTICGFTITGGAGTLTNWEVTNEPLRSGGGIFIDESSCIIEHNIISDNIISYDFSYVAGGGIYLNAGNKEEVIIRNNIVSDNKLSSDMQGTGGAGIAVQHINQYINTFLIENNRISGNTATQTTQKECVGGAISSWLLLPTRGEYIIKNNLIEHNELHGYQFNTYSGAILVKYIEPGGYFLDDNPSPEISNNIIRNNKAIPGGGAAIGIWTLWINHSSGSKVTPQPAIINNTIVDNRSHGTPGIFNWRSFPIVMNNIFRNEYIDPDFDDEFCIVSLPPLKNNGLFSAYHNVVRGGFHPIEDEVDINNYDEDPAFLADSLGLSDSSICVGGGLDSVLINNYLYKAPLTDYYGNGRPHPIDEFGDIGAIESPWTENIPPVVTAPDSLYQPDFIEAMSSEDGTIYLVPKSTEKLMDSIHSACKDTCSVKANVAEKITLKDYENDIYWLYATDASGNISEPKAFRIYGVNIVNRVSGSIILYPNPFKDILIVEHRAGLALQKIDLLSLDGRIVESYNQIKQDRLTIYRDNLTPGLYLLKIHSDKVYVKKIVIE